MPDHIRVFCKEDPPPSLQQLMEFFSEEGFDIRLDRSGGDDLEEEDVEDPSWQEATLIYSDEREPLQVECWREDESDEFSEMRDEHLEELEDFDGREKSRVVRHLKSSSFIVTITFLSEPGEEGVSIQNALVNFMANNHDGLTYIDGEGYYAGDELVLALG